MSEVNGVRSIIDESEPSIRADLQSIIDQAPKGQVAWQVSAKNGLHATFQVSR